MKELLEWNLLILVLSSVGLLFAGIVIFLSTILHPIGSALVGVFLLANIMYFVCNFLEERS